MIFVRYVEGARHHLRLRVKSDRADAHARFERALDDALTPARLEGDLVFLEVAPYFREYARYGAEAIDALERIWEADSDLVCELIADTGALDDPDQWFGGIQWNAS